MMSESGLRTSVSFIVRNPLCGSFPCPKHHTAIFVRFDRRIIVHLLFLPYWPVAFFSGLRIEEPFLGSYCDQQFHHFVVLFVAKPTLCVLLFEVLQPGPLFWRCHYSPANL
jgi:hypothetical protein